MTCRKAFFGVQLGAGPVVEYKEPRKELRGVTMRIEFAGLLKLIKRDKYIRATCLMCGMV